MSPLHRLPPHFVFGILQSGLTSAVASGIASWPQISAGDPAYWLRSWLLAWAAMLPLVVVAAPLLQRLARFLTRQRAA